MPEPVFGLKKCGVTGVFNSKQVKALPGTKICASSVVDQEVTSLLLLSDFLDFAFGLLKADLM